MGFKRAKSSETEDTITQKHDWATSGPVPSKVPQTPEAVIETSDIQLTVNASEPLLSNQITLPIISEREALDLQRNQKTCCSRCCTVF